MERLSPSWLTSAVTQAREALNGRFRMAQLKAPSLDGDAVLAAFHGVLQPLGAGPALGSPDALVHALFDAILRVASLGEAGASATAALRIILPSAPAALGADARRTIAAVANASLQLHREVGPDRTAAWSKRFAELAFISLSGPQFQPASVLFESIGLALAWQSGLAPYRRAALAAASTWPEAIAVKVLDAPATAFLKSPWYRPGATSSFPRLAHRIGGFTGLGGPFRRAPGVQPPHEGVFLVHDHARAFHLHADAYGAMLVNAGASPGAPSLKKAADQHTSVITTPDSLHVQVMALA